MINYIWGGMIVLSLIVGALTGNIEKTAAAAMEGAGSAVDMCIMLAGIMCLWTGLAKIGEKAGLVALFAKILKPIMKRLFSKIDPESKACGSMVMNIVANIFGMGNAATPLGIKAIGELNELNKKSTRASDEMCLFVVLNTASLQLVPTTLISLRTAYGSSAPGEIIFPIWLSGIAALIVGITAAKLFEHGGKK